MSYLIKFTNVLRSLLLSGAHYLNLFSGIISIYKLDNSKTETRILNNIKLLMVNNLLCIEHINFHFL